jgi:hypothetical protein
VIRLALLSGALSLLSVSAWAGETACHYEQGVLVVPAEVAGIAGDYILDTGTARTTLDETRAQADGLEKGESMMAGGHLAGTSRSVLALEIEPLDVRTWNLPTPVAGVIGADFLDGLVVDVSFAPCRVRISTASRAPAFAGRELDMPLVEGRPTVMAAVADERRQITGPFVLATGANAPVRLADDLAQAPAAKPSELYPDGVWLARLAQVRFAGSVGQDVAAGLMKPDGAVVGVLGGDVLAHFRLRFDFYRGKLTVAPIR